MKRNLFQLFFNVPDGTATGGAPPSPATPTTTPSATPASTTPSGTPGVGGAPAAATGATPPGGPSSTEPDRSTWIPPYRWNEMQGRYQTLEQNYNQMMQRMRVLMGVAEPANPEHTRIQEALFQVFPWMKNLHSNPQLVEKLLSMGQSGAFDEMASSSSQMWTRHAADMARHGVEQLAKVMGKDPKTLGANGLRRIARELNAFIAEDQTGERQQRYEMGDVTVVDEMLTELTGFYVQPAQTQQAVQGAQQVQRVRQLPSSGPRTAPPPPQANQPPAGQPRFANKKERFAAMRADFNTQQTQA